MPSEGLQVLELTLAAYSEYEEVLRPEYCESYHQHIVDTLGNIGSGEQLVAVLERSIARSALYYEPGQSFGVDVEDAAMSPDCPEVRLLAVAPEGRRHGVGRAIMEACIARARNGDAPGLVLHTMAMMKAAGSLYASMGFVRAPELDFRPAKHWFVDGFRLDLS